MSFPNLILCLLMLTLFRMKAEETLPALKEGKAPTNLDELWGNYDPRKEPLETLVVREWKEGNITFRYVVFTTGTFKGQKARLAAFYAFPKSERKLPGILHVHGRPLGGQLPGAKHGSTPFRVCEC